VDEELRRIALGHGSVRIDDKAHAEEHCIEVQLPFLQRVLGEVTVLPLVVGRAQPHEVSDVLDEMWGQPGVLLVVSTDLSHYHDVNTAQHLDSRTATAVVSGHADAITWDHACGATPLRASLALAGRHGQHAQLVDLATSADTGGPPDRVVGYGAFEFR